MTDHSRPTGAHSNNPTTPHSDEPSDIAVAQQQAIVDVLAHCAGQSEETIEMLLRRTLQDRNVPVPPDTWLGAVAGGIANDHLYVVGNGTVPDEYFSSESGGRASDRIEEQGHDLEPSEVSRERMSEGHAPGNQIV